MQTPPFIIEHGLIMDQVSESFELKKQQTFITNQKKND